ncbi:hypothetical protein D3C75_1047790 [compost metagenome]
MRSWAASRLRPPTTRVAATTAMRMPGTRSKRASSRMSASVPMPMAKAIQLACPASRAWLRARMSRSGPLLSMEMPNSLGVWLISTVKAMPFM